MRTILAFLILLAALGVAAQQPKPRVIVLTDISNEPDDEESMVRFLVYANEYDVEGLVSTTSVWLKDRIRPDLIRAQLDAYAQVYENLRKHAEGYPAPDALRAVVREGSDKFGMRGVGPGHSSPGSRLIIEAVDRDDPRPVWVLAWGGPNTLAQALWEVRATRPPLELQQFVKKLRVYTISDQDDSGAWLRNTFPELYYVVSPSTVDSAEYYLATWTGISGDRHYRNGPGFHFDLVDNPWLEENVIRGHGPLGAKYPRLEYIMEGDTPSFLNLIGNGLAGDTEPSYGGWGGRYTLRQSYGETRPIWTNSRDTVALPDGVSHTSNAATIWRWREAFQHDFAARMDWCVQPPGGANHNPRLVVNKQPGKGVLRIPAQPGETVRLSAVGSDDPDGHRLSYRWFQYPEAGTFRGSVAINGANTAEPVLLIPRDAKPGDAHIILEVMDSGDPALFAYRRVILSVSAP